MTIARLGDCSQSLFRLNGYDMILKTAPYMIRNADNRYGVKINLPMW